MMPGTVHRRALCKRAVQSWLSAARSGLGRRDKDFRDRSVSPAPTKPISPLPSPPTKPASGDANVFLIDPTARLPSGVFGNSGSANAYTYDGVHPLVYGHAVIAPVVADLMAAALGAGGSTVQFARARLFWRVSAMNVTRGFDQRSDHDRRPMTRRRAMPITGLTSATSGLKFAYRAQGHAGGGTVVALSAGTLGHLVLWWLRRDRCDQHARRIRNRGSQCRADVRRLLRSLHIRRRQHGPGGDQDRSEQRCGHRGRIHNRAGPGDARLGAR